LNAKFIYFCVLTLLTLGCATGTGNGSLKGSITIPEQVQNALDTHACNACHQANKDGVGPSYKRIAQIKYRSPEEILRLIRHPKPDRWPDFRPMMPVNMNQKDGETIADWLYEESRK
jgi:cytochrome c551/c552